jgi:hypothetical protein
MSIKIMEGKAEILLGSEQNSASPWIFNSVFSDQGPYPLE